MAQKEVLDRALYKKIKAMDRKNMEAFLKRNVCGWCRKCKNCKC